MLLFIVIFIFKFNIILFYVYKSQTFFKFIIILCFY